MYFNKVLRVYPIYLFRFNFKMRHVAQDLQSHWWWGELAPLHTLQASLKNLCPGLLTTLKFFVISSWIYWHLPWHMFLHTVWLLQVSYTLKSVASGLPWRYTPVLSVVFGPHTRYQLEKKVKSGVFRKEEQGSLYCESQSYRTSIKVP